MEGTAFWLSKLILHYQASYHDISMFQYNANITIHLISLYQKRKSEYGGPSLDLDPFKQRWVFSLNWGTWKHSHAAGLRQTLSLSPCMGRLGQDLGKCNLAPSPDLSLPKLWLTTLYSLRATAFGGGWKSGCWNPIESRCCIPLGLKSIWNVCCRDDEAVEMCPALRWHSSSWLLKITPKNITLKDIFRVTLCSKKRQAPKKNKKKQFEK